MEKLNCPLCCNELFESHDALHKHILELKKVLWCPSCKQSFEDLTELAEHLESFCVNRNVAVLKMEKNEVEEKEEVEQGKDAEQALYSCEACNMTFSSVQEHLDAYHNGEEVIVETDGSNVESETDSFMDGGDNDQIDMIQKIQNHKPTDAQPITAKFIILDGEAMPISEEDAAKIGETSKICAVHRCPNCDLQFPNLVHFQKHSCNADIIVGKRRQSNFTRKERGAVENMVQYQCTFCSATFDTVSQLTDHMKIHLVDNDVETCETPHENIIKMTTHQCDICLTKFPTYKQLRLHKKMHIVVKPKPIEPPVSYNIMGVESEPTISEKFQCPLCQKTYDKKYEEVHMKFHQEEQFNCYVCNRKLDNQENMDMHIKAHTNEKKFACSYCKKTFLNYESLDEHVKQCNKKSFECAYCGRRFSRAFEKVKHERIHTGEKPYPCDICGKSFRVAYCLTLHMRTHTNARPYTCNVCDKRFKSHGVFRHHMKTHSDERNYKCTFCPKAFKTAVQLAGHKKGHTKPFACKECNRPFASLYAVRAHMETHKRDNNLNFECGFCGASYARSFALKDHLNEVHGQDEQSAKMDTWQQGEVVEQGEYQVTEDGTSYVIQVQEPETQEVQTEA